ncbi:hypothetical protein HYFRA_00009611 [Hymenoscyphus fraxineus]|uniref:2EXR domain-containing protein n=1 Tax=Hymenoscyphus fraxineus TaxID=746836 RepID=A0A9N9PRI8_9HELO|nr:hypothetical protein HYFRA_00009611 [Hymenoscyphus fraxineus]
MSNNTPSTFHNFNKLPFELKVEIWKLAENDGLADQNEANENEGIVITNARSIFVNPVLRDDAPPNEIASYSFVVRLSGRRPLLAVNREWRNELLKNYVAPFSPKTVVVHPDLQAQGITVADLLVDPKRHVLWCATLGEALPLATFLDALFLKGKRPPELRILETADYRDAAAHKSYRNHPKSFAIVTLTSPIASSVTVSTGKLNA